jgi:hypothetical protein
MAQKTLGHFWESPRPLGLLECLSYTGFYFSTPSLTASDTPVFRAGEVSMVGRLSRKAFPGESWWIFVQVYPGSGMSVLIFSSHQD